MRPEALRDALAELAGEVGIDVRVVSGPGEGEPGLPLESGACRVRGRLWVVLAARDPVEGHIDVLARTLRAHAGDLLEGRFLPPAVRERLDEAGPGEGGQTPPGG